MAAHVWPDGAAVGRRIRLGTAVDAPWLTIVGVVDDVLYDWTDRVPEFVVYLPSAQSAAQTARYAIRVNGDPAAFAESAREQFAAVDPLLPTFDMVSLGDAISESFAGVSQIVWMLRLLGLLSAVIGVLGLYGLMAYLVAARTREFGVRMALGAGPADVFRIVMIRGAELGGVGLLCGTTLAVPAVQAARGLVFETSGFARVLAPRKGRHDLAGRCRSHNSRPKPGSPLQRGTAIEHSTPCAAPPIAKRPRAKSR
jgi:hypothetical protein